MWVVSLFLPLLGTTLGSLAVFFAKDKISPKTQKLLLGFASGVMVAAGIWSLIMPSIELAEASLKEWAFVPAAIGFLLGIFVLLGMDEIIPHLHLNASRPEGKKADFSKTTMLVLAVAIHNIPEGAAMGAVLAGYLNENAMLGMAGVLSLAIGIAIQNIPEGAIISLPLLSEGASKPKSFLIGVFTGILEPISAVLMIILIYFLEPILPYMLSFASGAMFYVVVEELIPEASEGEHSNLATIAFAIGFVLMMVLDVALG